MKRIVPFALVLAAGAVAYACSDSTDDPGTPTPQNEGGSNETGTNPDPDGSLPDGEQPDGTVVPTGDPIQGIAAPKQVADALGFADGPQWWNNTLYVSRPLDSFLLKVNLVGGTVEQVRQGDNALTGTQGNSIDKAGRLISAERSKITRTELDGGVTDISLQYNTADAGAGPQPYDTPNDLVARDDGTIYVTDPGYLTTITDSLNHLVRIAPNGTATLVEDFLNVPRPNGIALTKDQKILYVSFSRPTVGTKPFIRKYTVNTDGTLKDPTLFAELPTPTVADPGTNDDPDGLAVDDGGNVYVAYRVGINVYKADGTRYGAQPSIALAGPTGLTFSGAGDRKTMYVTTNSGKIFEIKVNVPGLAQ